MIEPLSDDFKVYPTRFLVVILFALVQMMTSVLMNTLTPVAAYLSEIYNEEPVVVNLGSLLFALMHPIFTFPAAYFIDTYGSRIGITIGCILCLIGTCLRLLVNQGFAWVIVGQIIAGIGRPFILNCQAKISASWFKADTRGAVTQYLTLIMNVSLILGFFIPSIVFGGYNLDKESPASIQQGKDLTYNLMLVQVIMAAVCYGLNILFQIDKPPTPPSDSANMERQHFRIAIPKMLTNVNYILLLIAFGCYFGIFNGMSIILSYLIEPWFGQGDLPLAVASVGGSPILSGIIGVIILGPMQRKSGEFKKWIIFCMLGSSVAIVLFYPLLQTGSLFWASFISAFNSFFLIPLVPIMLQLGCELVFPVGEGSAVGLLFAMGNLAGFLLGLFLSIIVQGESKAQTLYGIIFCFAFFILGLILVWVMKQQRNRVEAERVSAQKRRSSSNSKSQSANSANSQQRKDSLLSEDLSLNKSLLAKQANEDVLL